jgi:methionine-rich copper-binding protein CopC
MLRHRLPAAAVAATFAALALPPAALAHTPIKSYSPKPNSTADRDLHYVRVNFAASIEDAKVTVKSSGGTTVSRGGTALVRDGRQARVRLRSGLSAGRYRASVKWLSSDGHVQTKSWFFRLH